MERGHHLSLQLFADIEECRPCMNAPSNNLRKPEICLSCETYSHLYACGLLFVKSDQSLFEASDILALK